LVSWRRLRKPLHGKGFFLFRGSSCPRMSALGLECSCLPGMGVRGGFRATRWDTEKKASEFGRLVRSGTGGGSTEVPAEGLVSRPWCLARGVVAGKA